MPVFLEKGARRFYLLQWGGEKKYGKPELSETKVRTGKTISSVWTGVFQAHLNFNRRNKTSLSECCCEWVPALGNGMDEQEQEKTDFQPSFNW
ncbi:MAG: hypothetical protein AB1507_03885 [Bacillota bacterium]|nr:hypothetical protein [Thermoanaerobacteraceae bacterium]